MHIVIPLKMLLKFYIHSIFKWIIPVSLSTYTLNFKDYSYVFISLTIVFTKYSPFCNHVPIFEILFFNSAMDFTPLEDSNFPLSYNPENCNKICPSENSHIF